MEEETKEKEEDETVEDIKKETTTELDRADDIAERQKRENDRREELINREEALEARRTVGGKAEAGGENPKRTDAQKKDDNAQEFFKDTALGDAIKKTNE